MKLREPAAEGLPDAAAASLGTGDVVQLAHGDQDRRAGDVALHDRAGDVVDEHAQAQHTRADLEQPDHQGEGERDSDWIAAEANGRRTADEQAQRVGRAGHDVARASQQ